MIHRLSLEIADYLFYRKIITIDKYDIYSYGLEMIMSSVLGVILVALCGILIGSLIHAVVFYVLFIVLRMYTGGYHADTHLACKLTLCSSFLITNLAFNDVFPFYNVYVHIFLSLVNLIAVVVLSPIESSGKPLSNSIKNKNRIISICAYIIIIMITLCIYLISYREWALFPILVMTNVSMLMYIGYIKERRRKNED